MMEPVLDPFKSFCQQDDYKDESWPEELRTHEFMSFLAQSYDHSQLEAIRVIL